MKKRLDLILTELGYFETKAKASANILAGNVKIGGEPAHKAGELYNPEIFEGDNPVLIEVKSMPFVSRGGLKLDALIKHFHINLKDKVAIDIGASTGGFVDCMLQAGAKYVYAVDVGYNQLAWKLVSDSRVKNIEKTNAKNCSFKDIFGFDKADFKGELPSFMSMDLSFISIEKVLDNVLNFVSDDAEFGFLIKPQFEAKRNEVKKGGLIVDEDIRLGIVENVRQYAESLGLQTIGVIESPILGSKSGNKEFLIYLKRQSN